MSKRFTTLNAAVYRGGLEEDYIDTLEDLGIASDGDNWEFAPITVNLDHVEVLQPSTNKDGVANIFMISGEKWSVELTDEVKELFELK